MYYFFAHVFLRSADFQPLMFTLEGKLPFWPSLIYYFSLFDIYHLLYLGLWYIKSCFYAIIFFTDFSFFLSGNSRRYISFAVNVDTRWQISHIFQDSLLLASLKHTYRAVFLQSRHELQSLDSVFIDRGFHKARILRFGVKQKISKAVKNRLSSGCPVKAGI